MPDIATTPEIDRLLADNAPVAIGVSGGKDSIAVALATMEHLARIRHTGPCVLMHADLGVTEWSESLTSCQRVAERLKLELIVVRRPGGDMMQRWEQRWRDNVKRYQELSCVQLILPWSTPSMRFCTSELKVDQICRDLKKRFPGQVILNATGIRREESTERAKAPIAKPQEKLTSKTLHTTGWDWHPTIEWTLDEVLAIAERYGIPRHEAYTKFGSSRVSCVWCILATEADHKAGARDRRNHPLGRRMVNLEIASTFAFQGSRWLGDTLHAILSPEQRRGLVKAKEAAELRQAAEAKIPKHLLYTKGWPTCLPTLEEAKLLGNVRKLVTDAVGLSPSFTEAEAIRTRYAELLTLKSTKPSRRPRARLNSRTTTRSSQPTASTP